MNMIIQQDMEQIRSCDIPWKSFQDQTVLITGASGMLPSYMALTLAFLNEWQPSLNIRILAVVRNQDKAETIFRPFLDKPYLRLIKADLSEPFTCDERVDYIIHGASNASSQFFTKDPAGTFLPNVLGTHELLRLAQRDSAKGFLFFSSGEIYGNTAAKRIDEETVGMVDPLNLRNSYAEGKRAGEMLCKIWCSQYNVPAKIARISHTFGPTMDLKNDGRVFCEFINNIINNEDIVMKSDGSAVRPFCYISDATTAFFKILLQGQPGEAYNVCHHDGYFSVLELANMLVTLFPEKNLKVVRQQRAEGDAYQESLANEPCVTDNKKLRSLGWTPAISVEEGFRRTILCKTQL